MSTEDLEREKKDTPFLEGEKEEDPLELSDPLDSLDPLEFSDPLDPSSSLPLKDLTFPLDDEAPPPPLPEHPLEYKSKRGKLCEDAFVVGEPYFLSSEGSLPSQVLDLFAGKRKEGYARLFDVYKKGGLKEDSSLSSFHSFLEQKKYEDALALISSALKEGKIKKYDALYFAEEVFFAKLREVTGSPTPLLSDFTPETPLEEEFFSLLQKKLERPSRDSGVVEEYIGEHCFFSLREILKGEKTATLDFIEILAECMLNERAYTLLQDSFGEEEGYRELLTLGESILIYKGFLEEGKSLEEKERIFAQSIESAERYFSFLSPLAVQFKEREKFLSLSLEGRKSCEEYWKNLKDDEKEIETYKKIKKYIFPSQIKRLLEGKHSERLSHIPLSLTEECSYVLEKYSSSIEDYFKKERGVETAPLLPSFGYIENTFGSTFASLLREATIKRMEEERPVVPLGDTLSLFLEKKRRIEAFLSREENVRENAFREKAGSIEGFSLHLLSTIPSFATFSSLKGFFNTEEVKEAFQAVDTSGEEKGRHTFIAITENLSYHCRKFKEKKKEKGYAFEYEKEYAKLKAVYFSEMHTLSLLSGERKYGEDVFFTKLFTRAFESEMMEIRIASYKWEEMSLYSFSETLFEISRMPPLASSSFSLALEHSAARIQEYLSDVAEGRDPCIDAKTQEILSSMIPDIFDLKNAFLVCAQARLSLRSTRKDAYGHIPTSLLGKAKSEYKETLSFAYEWKKNRLEEALSEYEEKILAYSDCREKVKKTVRARLFSFFKDSCKEEGEKMVKAYHVYEKVRGGIILPSEKEVQYTARFTSSVEKDSPDTAFETAGLLYSVLLEYVYKTESRRKDKIGLPFFSEEKGIASPEEIDYFISEQIKKRKRREDISDAVGGAGNDEEEYERKTKEVDAFEKRKDKKRKIKKIVGGVGGGASIVLLTTLLFSPSGEDSEKTVFEALLSGTGSFTEEGVGDGVESEKKESKVKINMKK